MKSVLKRKKNHQGIESRKGLWRPYECPKKSKIWRCGGPFRQTKSSHSGTGMNIACFQKSEENNIAESNKPSEQVAGDKIRAEGITHSCVTLSATGRLTRFPKCYWKPFKCVNRRCLSSEQTAAG